MGGIFISVFMFLLLVVCGLMTVIILMQKPSANAGMGAALGGGAAESVFGGETANVLLKYTVRISVVFFVLSFLLYLGILVHHRGATASSDSNVLNHLNMGTTPAAGAASANTTTTSATTPATDVKLLKDEPAAPAPVAPAASATPAASTAPAPAN